MNHTHKAVTNETPNGKKKIYKRPMARPQDFVFPLMPLKFVTDVSCPSTNFYNKHWPGVRAP